MTDSIKDSTDRDYDLDNGDEAIEGSIDSGQKIYTEEQSRAHLQDADRGFPFSGPEYGLGGLMGALGGYGPPPKMKTIKVLCLVGKRGSVEIEEPTGDLTEYVDQWESANGRINLTNKNGDVWTLRADDIIGIGLVNKEVHDHEATDDAGDDVG